MGKLRIYDEKTLMKHLRLKRLQVLAIFAAGALCGLWLADSNHGAALAATPVANDVAVNQLTPWCVDQTSNAATLRMDCELKSFSP